MDIFDKKKLDGNFYCCVIHHRRRSAYGRGVNAPEDKYIVVYNANIKTNVVNCNDSGKYLKVTITPDELVLKFKNHEEKLQYQLDKVCCYNVPLYDAMESWEFIISESPINYEDFKNKKGKI